jgi:RNA polymerase sigma-70 factor (ECF subfamily)
MPDDLKAELAEGHEAAFAALYDQLGDRLYRAAVRWTGSADQADDAVQETFVALVRYRRNLRHVADLEAYVFTMLRHAIRRRRPGMPMISLTTIDPPANPPPARDDGLAGALERLPEDQRQTVALKIDGGLTFAQIGRVTGVSQHTAASRYRLALDKLRQWLGERS